MSKTRQLSRGEVFLQCRDAAGVFTEDRRTPAEKLFFGDLALGETVIPPEFGATPCSAFFEID